MSSKYKKELALRLNQLRGEKKVTEFSKLLGVGNSTVWYYVSGYRIPPADFLALVVKKLNVDGHWLLTGVGDDPYL